MATQLNIKDAEAHRLANELARRRGISATRAVKAALEETLARENEEPSPEVMERVRETMAWLAEGAKRWPQDKTSKELMDALYEDDDLP